VHKEDRPRRSRANRPLSSGRTFSPITKKGAAPRKGPSYCILKLRLTLQARGRMCILFIGIRTLFDRVTRGYGDHSPLTIVIIHAWGYGVGFDTLEFFRPVWRHILGASSVFHPTPMAVPGPQGHRESAGCVAQRASSVGLNTFCNAQCPAAWCLLYVLIRQGLRGGSGPQRLIRETD